MLHLKDLRQQWAEALKGSALALVGEGGTAGSGQAPFRGGEGMSSNSRGVREDREVADKGGALLTIPQTVPAVNCYLVSNSNDRGKC